jgi:predicted phage-related endonuclease
MLANLDREVIGAHDVQILECKTAGEFGARLWRDGVPDYVQIQVQHQLAVTGKKMADVAVLLCGQKLEVHTIRRDEELIANLIRLEAAFWNYVTGDTPPPADGSGSAERALRCLYPGTSATVDFQDDRRLSSVFADLVSRKASIKAQEGEAELLKQTLLQAMGDASVAQFESGKVSFKRSKDTVTFDTERFLADHPELAQQYYTLVKPGSRRFRICE